MTYNHYVLDLLKDKHVSLLGFGDLSEVPHEQRQGFKYGICIAIALETFPSVGDIPSIEYYNEYKRINMELRKISLFLEDKIIEKGYHAYSLWRNRQNEDFRTVLPFKTLATRSGLGWIGKSSTLITKEFGSAVRLNGLITDMPFKTAVPINTSYCGDCMECVNNCPANAIKGNNWNLKTDRNDLIDPFCCKKFVIKRGEQIGVTVGSCGICISVCPWTKQYMKRQGIELYGNTVGSL